MESGLPLVGPLIEFSSTPRPFLQRLEKQVRAARHISRASSSLNLCSVPLCACRVVLRACACGIVWPSVHVGPADRQDDFHSRA